MKKLSVYLGVSEDWIKIVSSLTSRKKIVEVLEIQKITAIAIWVENEISYNRQRRMYERRVKKTTRGSGDGISK